MRTFFPKGKDAEELVVILLLTIIGFFIIIALSGNTKDVSPENHEKWQQVNYSDQYHY